MTTDTPAADLPPLDLDAIRARRKRALEDSEGFANGLTDRDAEWLFAEVTALRAELDAARAKLDASDDEFRRLRNQLSDARAETERLGRKWEQAFADVRDQRDAARADLQIAQRANDTYAAEDAARAERTEPDDQGYDEFVVEEHLTEPVTYVPAGRVVEERTEPATVECLTCNGRGGNWNCMGLAPEGCLCGVCTDNATCPGCGAEATRPEPATATGCGRRSVTGDCPDHPLPEPATGEDVEVVARALWEWLAVGNEDALEWQDADGIDRAGCLSGARLVLTALDLRGRERALREEIAELREAARVLDLARRADLAILTADRNDYAARLKATDASWAQVAAERDAANAALADARAEIQEMVRRQGNRIARLQAEVHEHLSPECQHNVCDGCDETVVCRNECWCTCHNEDADSAGVVT